MYAIHFTPSGSTYAATKEEFVARAPLPLTDVCINPKDGAMYFTIGGRNSQAALYRVTYTGDLKTVTRLNNEDGAKERDLRRRQTLRARPSRRLCARTRA